MDKEEPSSLTPYNNNFLENYLTHSLSSSLLSSLSPISFLFLSLYCVSETSLDGGHPSLYRDFASPLKSCRSWFRSPVLLRTGDVSQHPGTPAQAPLPRSEGSPESASCSSECRLCVWMWRAVYSFCRPKGAYLHRALT